MQRLKLAAAIVGAAIAIAVIATALFRAQAHAPGGDGKYGVHTATILPLTAPALLIIIPC